MLACAIANSGFVHQILLRAEDMQNLLAHVIAAFIALNGWTMLRFWQDKQRARARDRRIPEADLLGLALIGGSPGAFLARRLFHHKSRKEPFSTRLQIIAMLQAGLLIGLALANL